MKNQKTYSLLGITLIALCFMFACKKNQNTPASSSAPSITPPYDTIKPLDYFPAFPGSYWRYVDSNNDTTVINTDPAYKKDSYHYGPPAATDTFFVPVYDHIPIWGYQAHTGPISNPGSYQLTRILSDSLPLGSNWVIAFWQQNSLYRKIIAKDTSISISGNTYYPTLGIEEYSYAGVPGSYVWRAKRYYTKDIGLIREDINNMDSTITTKQLLDYFIND